MRTNGNSKREYADIGGLHDALPGAPVYLGRGSLPRGEDWIPKLEAWLPQYVRHHGNLCLVALEDGVFYTGQRANWLFRRVARHYLIDPGQLRREYIRCHNKYQSVPLVAAPRRTVYFAVKVRSVRPEHKNDGVMGYVANTRIRAVEPVSERETRLWLASGFTMDLRMSVGHLEQQRRLAETFELYLARKGLLPAWAGGPCDEWGWGMALPGATRPWAPE